MTTPRQSRPSEFSADPPAAPVPSSPPPLKRYRVMLSHCAEKGLLFFVKVVRDLMHFGDAEATFRMWDAYHHGRTVALITHLELAELFVELFREQGLPASLEPA